MCKYRGATHDDMLALWHQAVFEAHRAHVINAPARMGLVFMNDKSQRLYGNIENYGWLNHHECARASMTPRRRCGGWFGRFCLVKRLVRHFPFGFASCGLRRTVSTRRDAGRHASFHLFLGYRPTKLLGTPSVPRKVLSGVSEVVWATGRLWVYLTQPSTQPCVTTHGYPPRLSLSSLSPQLPK